MRPVNLLLIGLALGGFLRPFHFALAQAPVPSGTVITIAGNGVGGFSGDGGPALDASLNGHYGSAIGPDGTLYFADSDNWRIRAVNPVTGIITTVAGNGSIGDHDSNDGPATAADLGYVISVAVDRARNALYLGDSSQNWVSKVDLSTNLLSRYAGTGIFDGGLGFSGDGGPATSASLGFPDCIATDGFGQLFIADSINSRIRRVDPVTGIITTIAGNGDFVSTGDGGPATAASFASVSRVAADSAGNVFVIDSDGPANIVLIRRIDATTGIITTVAGGGATTPGTGPATDMNLGSVFSLAVDDDGTLFIGGGPQASQVFKVDLGTGLLSPFAGAAVNSFSGDGGPALDARFSIIGGLTVAPGGGLVISDVDNARIRYIAPDSIHLVGDAGQTQFYLPWVSTLLGDAVITNNPNLLVIDMSSLTSTGGSISLGDNTAATVIDLSSLTTVGGDLTIETTGNGTFDVDGADVEGNTSLTTDGYTEVDAATAGGATAVTMLNSEATMEVTLPDGAFTSATPVAFSITNLPGGSVETVDGEMVTHLASYAFDFAIPTLDSAAELNFEIDLAALDEPDRLLLLDLVHESAELTLGVLNDTPGSELQLFDVCSGGGPMADACVVVQWLDENRMLLDPLGGLDPSILRFEALVGNFSTYSVVAVGLAGDYNHNGVVDAADYIVWRDTLGQSGTDLAADGNNSGTIDSGDYGVWRAHFGKTNSSGAGASANVAVPEPATLVLFILGMMASFTFRRAFVS